MGIETTEDLIREYPGAEYWWKPLDVPILCACEVLYPTHADVNEVFAKVALVNRAYRANLQMGGERAEWKLAEELVARKFDRVLDRAKTVAAFSAAALPVVLDVHAELVEACHKATGRKAISFASKYLSFHYKRVFPIYDSKAYDTAWRLVGAEVGGTQHDVRDTYDYGYFCEALLILIAKLEAGGVVAPDLKILDNMLYDDLW